MLLLYIQQILAYMQISNDQSFNDTLTNDIVSFEQLSPGSELLFLFLMLYLDLSNRFVCLFNILPVSYLGLLKNKSTKVLS